jgi:hypothetical protein
MDAYLNNIRQRLGSPKKVSVGFLAGSTEVDGASLPLVAATQEFGSAADHIPPRPFFRSMIAKHKAEWSGQLAKVVRSDGYDAVAALNQMGEVISGELRQSIIDTNAPALSPVTLMLRKMKSRTPGLIVTRTTVGEAAARVKAGESTSGVSTKPLVETGTMLQGVNHEVEETSS